MTKRKYLTFTNDVAPVHDGVYQREFKTFRGANYWKWAMFSRGFWFMSDNDYKTAECMGETSGYQVGDVGAYSSLRWRGLANKPEL